MAFGGESERSERARVQREAPVVPPSSADARDARAAADHTPADVALRLAVEALSAEICWFVANDAGARGIFVAAGAATESRSRPPTT